MTPQTPTQNSSTPLSIEQQKKLIDLSKKLSLLLYVSPESADKIDGAIESELARLNTAAASLSEEEKQVCLSSAGRFGGQAGITAAAAFKAKQKADAAVVAGIPKESLVILKIMHGDDVVKLAAAWRAQAVTGARR